MTPQCISVGASGDVTVTWDASGTPAANFRSWHICFSVSQAGPFSVIDSNIVYTDTTYNHAGANAILSAAFYYIVFKSSNGTPDIISDTIRAINLSLSNAAGYANLSWNATHNPLNAGDSPFYLIYREYPPGNITLIDSVDARLNGQMSYQDLITICDDTIKYRIEVRNSAGCSSLSALKADRFQDVQVPVVPPVDSVSVTAAGTVIISWQPSTSSDTKEYIILQQGAGGVTSIDTLVGINSTTLSTLINATGSSQTFFILAVDNCNNISAPSTPHSTIYLTNNFNQCGRSVILNWNDYSFWGTAPQYEILVSLNGGPETVAGTTSLTTFTDTNLTSGASMCYRIRAIEPSGTKTSTSNSTCITPLFASPPAYCYIRKATVISEEQIQITAFVDAFTSVAGYNLYRSTDPSGGYTVIGTQNINNTSSVTFYDNVHAADGPYYYYLTAFDTCGRNVITSQVSQTMVLTGTANKDYVNSLSWTEYNGWPNGVEYYNLYLSYDGITKVIPLTTLILPPFSYLDSVFNNFNSSGKFCYTIEAIEEQGNPFGLLDSSRSNEICLEHPQIIFIPNAFHPGGGFNSVFNPSNSFVPADGYSLDIYDRWGEKVFHSSDPAAGWDGSYKGRLCPEGVYIYRLISKTESQSDIDHLGAVTLIR